MLLPRKLLPPGTEAKERMLDQNATNMLSIHKNNYNILEPYTLLAFWKLGMKKSEVMQDEHYEDIGRSLGIEVTVYSNGEEKTGICRFR